MTHRPAQLQLRQGPASQDLSFLTCKIGITLPPHQFSGLWVQRLDGHECEEHEAGTQAKLEMHLTRELVKPSVARVREAFFQPPGRLCAAG